MIGVAHLHAHGTLARQQSPSTDEQNQAGVVEREATGRDARAGLRMWLVEQRTPKITVTDYASDTRGYER